jgi:predicted rRNA methylase YqxC with S4 and FtsJ domains
VKYKLKLNKITKDDYDLMYKEKTAIMKHLKRNYKKLAPKLLYMIDVFEKNRVFTVPIEICERVISMDDPRSQVSNLIKSNFEKKKQHLEKALADDIVWRNI